jgi:hypothetical protein
MMDQGQEAGWRQLCQAAAIEQDPDKLLALVAEINKALGELHSKPERGTNNNKDCGGSSFPTLYAA